MNNYNLSLELKSGSGQLLRCIDMHFRTRKEAVKTTVKMVWIIAGKQTSIYEVFTDEIFHCANSDNVLIIKLKQYKVIK